jgi:hypothetical protein
MSGLHPIAIACAATMLVCAPAGAQVTVEDARCRAAIHKNAAKLGAVANKAVDRCIKTNLKTFSGGDCNDLAIADTQQKVTAASAKLGTNIAAKCALPANSAALAQFPRCPSPADADDGIDGVDDFTELAACETTINTDGIEMMRRYVLDPDYDSIGALPNSKNVAKCGNAIARNVTKAWRAAAKLRGKDQATRDHNGQSYEYAAHAVSTTAIEIDCLGGISNGCSGLASPDFHALRACNNSAGGVAVCTCKAALKNAHGATAVAYDMDGVCPSEALVSINSRGGGGGILTDTALDVGWTGLGHGGDVDDRVVGSVNLACSSDDCSSCQVSVDCDGGNCRCRNNQSIACTVPFVTGGPCGAGTCAVVLGPPLPFSAGGSPMCVVNVMTSALTGVADAGTGKANVTIESETFLGLGIAQNQPCPTCSGGTCQGGFNNGAPCTVDAIHPDFGPLSYDCQFRWVGDVFPDEFELALELTDAPVSLAFEEQADPPFTGMAVACGTCSGDNDVACMNDAECAALALGTCGRAPAAALRQPNDCTDLTCEEIAGSGGKRGVCTGDSDLYCDGFVRQGGGGIITCASDLDCSSLDTDCPANDCGTCTLEQPRGCYLDPIIEDGVNGPDGAEVVSTFCFPSTISSGINAAVGLPGAARLKLDVDFTAYCSDGVTEHELGGANCP